MILGPAGMPGVKITDLFEQLREGLLAIDPVAFCEKYLTLDGKPFRLNGNGYKPFADIYRYIGIKALEKDSKPVVLVKGRQVGATTMAAALELFFMTSGMAQIFVPIQGTRCAMASANEIPKGS